jgi:hypothetical protein
MGVFLSGREMIDTTKSDHATICATSERHALNDRGCEAIGITTDDEQAPL